MAKDTLDLHGFRADEVEDAVDKFLMKVNELGLERARIMTGKGTGTVQKIVKAYLKAANYPFKYEKLPNGKDNEGVLVIYI
jgi:dsDNA-specific endonuclease/ATPase MutS2